jgi:hypothetical protein
MRYESGAQTITGLSLWQHAEWVTATAASPLGNDIPLVRSLDTRKGIRELPPFLLRRGRATQSSSTLEFTANA